MRIVVAGFGVQGHEQGDGESALVVGQGDAHVAPARPDVQRVGFDAEAAVARGRDLELLVAVVEPFGALAEIMAGSHLSAQRGACAVAAEQGVRSEEHTSELQSLMRNSYAVL